GETFLGAERRHDLGLGVELHPEAAAVIARLRLAQARDAARGGIAVGARLAGDLLELLQHMSRRREVRVSHAQIDDVRPGIARRGLGAVDLLEDVRRQAANAVELFHRRGSSALFGGGAARALYHGNRWKGGVSSPSSVWPPAPPAQAPP